MRLLSFVSLTLVFGFARGQDKPSPPNLDLKVSFTQPAEPLSRLMPQLADLTKAPLKVAKGMETEVVLISVHDVTVDELLKRIATATGGNWSQSGGFYYLAPSSSGREKLRVRAFTARAAALAADLKKLDPTNRKDASTPTAGQRDIASSLYGSQGDAVFYQLLSEIGPQQLASLLPGDRAVLSTKPMSRQYALPASDDAIAAYIDRHNVEAEKEIEAAKKSIADAGNSGGEDQNLEDMVPTQVIKGAPSKAILIISRTGGIAAMTGNGALTCQLVLYDGVGKELSRDRANVGGFFDAAEMEELIQDNTGKAKPSSTPPLELSSDTKQFINYFRSMEGGMDVAAPKKLSAEDQEAMHSRLMHPETYDPLACPANLISAYASAKNLQLVASLPDSFNSWLMYLMMSTPTAERVEKRLMSDTDLVVDSSDGWLTVSPGDFRSEPMSRDDLVKIMVGLVGKKDPTIEELASAAVMGLGDPSHGMLPEIWLILASPSLSSLFTQDWDMLRLYGTLSQDQLATLSNSKRLSFAAMTEGQKDLLDRMIYGGSSGLSFFTGDAPLRVEQKKDEGSVLGAADSMFDNQLEDFGIDGETVQDYRSEPTEVAPNGLPPGTAITLKVNSSQVLEPVVKGKESPAIMGAYSQPMAVEQLAGIVAMKDSPAYAQMAAYFPVFDHVNLGTKRSLHFRIYVSVDSFKSSTLSDCHFADGDSYALGSLPADLQKKFDTTLKMMREAYKGAGNGDAAGAATPPR